MGVAPGVATEFWLYDPNDFCADLKNWTSTLLADESPPLVTSVSYGWQGNLTGIGCKDSDVAAVDADFAKLATKGITIIFASGDSGSGYTHPHPVCANFQDNTELTGTVSNVMQVSNLQECCEYGSEVGGIGWSYAGKDTPPGPPPGPTKCAAGTSGRALDGHVLQHIEIPDVNVCCEFSQQMGLGYTFVPKGGKSPHGQGMGNCTIFKTVTGHHPAPTNTVSGMNKPRNVNNCTIFSTVTGKKSSNAHTSSSPSSGKNVTVVLWPSWPASSPWVTSVGATRFVGQTAGNEEMASDQFGSGGGFSKQFQQSPNAKWQSDDVAHYLKVVPKGAPFPPETSFPALGRATPDVAALGEGFQVLQSGRVMAVGGTSASAPTFAGIVSLLNEHQLQQGKKPLGFLNPFIYANVAAFTDVIKGTNAIGRGTGPIKYGFNCTDGWDPATGVGTPVFTKLLAAVDKL